MRIGINVPQDVGPEATSDAVAAFAGDAEATGFDSLWVSESHRPGVLDPLILLTHVAATTGRVCLGTGVLLGAFRSPRELAATLASIDRLSEGRLTVGLGLGNDPTEYARRGIEPGHRGDHFTAPRGHAPPAAGAGVGVGDVVVVADDRSAAPGGSVATSGPVDHVRWVAGASAGSCR